MAIPHPVNHQHALTPQELSALTGGAKYGDQMDEVGGSGDFIDVISFRDTAMVRYIRYHEWMELVLGTAVETRRYVAGPKSTTDIEAKAKSQYIDKMSVKGDLLGTVSDLDEETQNRNVFYRKATEILREDFGMLSTSSLGENTNKESVEQSLENELKEKFGLVVVEKPAVKRVNVKFEVPEQLTKQAVEATKGPVPQPVAPVPQQMQQVNMIPQQQQQQQQQQPQQQQPQQQMQFQQPIQGMPMQAANPMMQGMPTGGMPSGQPMGMPVGRMPVAGMPGMPMQGVPMTQAPVVMPPGSQDINMSNNGMGGVNPPA